LKLIIRLIYILTYMKIKNNKILFNLRDWVTITPFIIFNNLLYEIMLLLIIMIFFSIKTRLLKIIKRTRYREITFRTFHMRNNIDGNAFLNRQADHVLKWPTKPKRNSDDVSSGRNAIAITYCLPTMAREIWESLW